MLGAIIGDIVGSRFEWNNNRSKDFDFLTYKCFATDDSIMSLAIAKAILDSKKDRSNLGDLAINWMQTLGKKYPNAGYGGRFSQWLRESNPQPYNSWDNGSAMRVSACGFVANSIDEAILLSKSVTEVTHNHPEGIKGAEYESSYLCAFFLLYALGFGGFLVTGFIPFQVLRFFWSSSRFAFFESFSYGTNFSIKHLRNIY